MPKVNSPTNGAAVTFLLLLSFAMPQISQASPLTTEQQQASRSAATEMEVQRSLRTMVFVHSDTVYMKTATMRSWLQRQPEFNGLSLAFAADQGHADYYVEVTRPTFTWDWTYSVVKTKSGNVVGSGKVTAATAERAAKALAPKVIQALYTEAFAQETMVRTDVSRRSANETIRPKRFMAYEQVARKLESAKTIFIRSSTVWFDERDLTTALTHRPEFTSWGYALVNACGQEVTSPGAYQACGQPVGPAPDLIIEINRPLFTWDWTYRMQESKTKTSIASGKVTAINEVVAAEKLAKTIIGVIANARGLPAGMQRKFDLALAETKVRTWDLRHISGQSHLKSGKNIQLAVGEKVIFARDGDELLFSVPMEDLLQFSYSSKISDRAVKWFEGWEKAGNIMFSGVGDDPNTAMGALMIMLPMLGVEYGVGGLLKGTTSTDHFLNITWNDPSAIVMTILQGKENDIREICAELNKVSKHSATDLDAAAQKVRDEFDQQLETTHYSIDTEQAVTVENSVLTPGRYRVVVLQRGKNLAEVYLLHESDNTIAAQTMVQYTRNAGAHEPVRVAYATVSGLKTFDEIQIGEHVLRFGPPGIAPEQI